MRKPTTRLFAALAALLGATSMTASAADAPTDMQNWREVPAENLLVFDTTKGRIVIELAPQFSPAHVARIKQITKDGRYDGTRFHRVIDGFMAQGGDTMKRIGADGKPLPEEEEYAPIPGEFTFERDPSAMPVDLIGPPESASMGYIDGFPVQTQSEFLIGLTDKTTVTTNAMHCPGVTSMARTNDPNSATDQFFLMRGTSEWLDSQYTVWGRVLKGLDVVLAISVGEPPRRPDTLLRAQLVADMPAGERPRAFVKRTDGPEMVAARLAAFEGGTWNPCDLDPVPAIVIDPADV